MPLYELTEKEANFTRDLLRSILPSPGQVQTQQAMRIFLDNCGAISKKLETQFDNSKDAKK